VWAWQATFAFVAAWPAASLVRATFGNDARGDASLWEPGGLALLDTLVHNRAGVEAASGEAIAVALVAMAAGWVPLTALMTAVARPAARTTPLRTGLATLRALPTFAKVAVVAGGVQGVTLGIGVFVAMLVEGWTHTRLGEAPAQILAAAVGLPFLLAAVALGVAHDVTRAAIVVQRASTLRGLAAGLRLYQAAPASLTWSWTWRTLASLALVAIASVLGDRLGSGTLSVVAVALVHQGVAFSRVALRASWLARALRAASHVTASDL
jgi:hypothetical protein